MPKDSNETSSRGGKEGEQVASSSKAATATKALTQRIGKDAFTYPPHLPAQDLQEGWRRGKLIRGRLAVNRRCASEGFVKTRAALGESVTATDTDSVQAVLISGKQDLNRALEGDDVAIEVKLCGDITGAEDDEVPCALCCRSLLPFVCFVAPSFFRNMNGEWRPP